MAEATLGRILKKTPDTVLVVDDMEINRAILCEIFQTEYEIEEAENGLEAWQILEAQRDRICAVLLDVVMPVMDGMELLRKMKEKGVLEDIPVFLITAEAGDKIVQESYSLGVMDVISKPIVPWVVMRRVNSVVELFLARKRLDNKVAQQQEVLLQQAQQIFDLNKGMVEALATSIEFRSGESGEHVQRIHDITEYMLRETPLGKGLHEEEIIQISLASIMHDIGKIAIPDAILNKPGRFTPEEFEIMKQHTVYGCQMLEKIPQMKSNKSFEYAYDIIRHHHERWDGRGYPDGLKGEEISVWSQVVSIADVYDALVSKRVYKDALGFEEAISMIRDGKCGAFNPELLEQFLENEKAIRTFYQDRK